MVCLHDLCVQCLHVWCLPELSVAPWGTRKPDLSTLSPYSSQALFDVIPSLWSLCSFLPHLWSFCVWSLLHHLHLVQLCFIYCPLLLWFCFLSIWLSFLLFPPKGNTIESEHLSELTEEEYEAHIYQRQDLKGFMWLDAKYLNPFFTRRLTQEVRERMQNTLIVYCLKIHQPHFNNQFEEECNCQSGPYHERPQAHIKLLIWWRVGDVLVTNCGCSCLHDSSLYY